MRASSASAAPRLCGDRRGTRLPAGRAGSRHHQHQWYSSRPEINCVRASSASAAPCLRADHHGTTHHEHQSQGVCLRVAPATGITSISGTVLIRRATKFTAGQHIMSISCRAFAYSSHGQPASPASAAHSSSCSWRASSASAAPWLCGDRLRTTHDITSIIRTAFACRSHRQPASPASVEPCSSGEQLCARIISISCTVLVWRSPWDDTS